MFSPGNLGRGGMAVAPVLHPLVGGSTFNTWRLVNTGGEHGRANEAHRPMGVGAWRWEHYWGAITQAFCMAGAIPGITCMP